MTDNAESMKDDEEIRHIESLIDLKTRRLRILELQFAEQPRGDPSVQMQIEDLNKEIVQSKENLARQQEKLAQKLDTARQKWNILLPPEPLFIGHEDTISDIKNLLPQVRILVLVGMGGIGKTHLALKVAQELCSGFANGGLYVDFRSLGDASLVLNKIIRAFKFQLDSDNTPLELLQKQLRDKELLLVLDSFEDAIGSEHDIEQLLALVPRLKILINSRIVPQLKGAQLIWVKELNEAAAGKLFEEGAKLRDFHYRPTDSDASTIRKICALLGHIPLAISLVAPTVDRTTDLKALLKNLEVHLSESLKSVDDMITWSYGRLDTQQQKLFRQFGVFSGGCTTEVAAIYYQWMGSAHQIGSNLALLRNNSLLQIDTESQPPRYRMLEPLRAYALQQLHIVGEAEQAYQHQAGLFFDQVMMKSPASERSELQAFLRNERADVFAAMQWFIAHNRTDAALRLGVTVWRFWYSSGYIREGLQLFDKAFEHVTVPPPLDLRGEAYLAACGLAWACGELSQADKYRENAFNIFKHYQNELNARKRLEYKSNLARTYNLWGVILEQQKEYSQARDKYKQSLKLYEQLNVELSKDRSLGNLDVDQLKIELGKARVLGNLGVVAQRTHNYKMAAEYYEKCRIAFKTIEDEEDQAIALFNLGEVKMLRSNPSEAYRTFDDSIVLSQRVGDLVNIIYCLEGLMWTTYKQGKLQVAASLRWAAITLRNEINVPPPKAEALDYARIANEVESQLGSKAWNATTLQGLCIARQLRVRAEATGASTSALSLEEILSRCQSIDEQS